MPVKRWRWLGSGAARVVLKSVFQLATHLQKLPLVQLCLADEVFGILEMDPKLQTGGFSSITLSVAFLRDELIVTSSFSASSTLSSSSVLQ